MKQEKKKTRPYPAVLRQKERYLEFKFESESKPAREAALRALSRAVLETLGTSGAAEAGFQVIEYNEAMGKGILRCSVKELWRVRASLAMLADVDSKPAFVHVLGVYGTLKKTRK